MTARATQQEVARAAGVSEATVSRVLNNSPLVHGETRRRVEKVIQELGYFPSAAARNLSLSKTDVIGVVFHQISSGFFATVLAAVEAEARAHGYHLLTAISHDTPEERELWFGMLDETRVDGMIVLDSGLSDDSVNRLKQYGKPFVLMERELEDASVNTIAVQNRSGARSAMAHLLDLGYRDILVVNGPAGAQNACQRLDGCRDALAGVQDAQVHYVEGFYHPDRAVEAFWTYRERNGLPRAVFALNDAMAIAILKEVRRADIRVPEQMAVVGFDGIDSADHLDLTTIDTPMDTLGRDAVRLLLKHLDDPDAKAEQIQLKTKLVVRKTCGG